MRSLFFVLSLAALLITAGCTQPTTSPSGKSDKSTSTDDHSPSKIAGAGRRDPDEPADDEGDGHKKSTTAAEPSGKNPSDKVAADETADTGETMTDEEHGGHGEDPHQPFKDEPGEDEVADEDPAALPETAEGVGKKAERLLRKEKFEEAATLLVEGAKKFADDNDLQANAMVLSAQLGQKLSGENEPEKGRKFSIMALEFADKIAGNEALPAMYREFASKVMFWGAEAQAQSGDESAALDTLKKAIDAGYSESSEIAKSEAFASLRENPEFLSLLESVRAAFRKHVDKMFEEHKPYDFDFAGLKDTEGKEHSLSALKGKVVVVDFWGTWCPPCRKEIPHFIALQEKHAEQGLAIIGMTYEGQESKDPETEEGKEAWAGHIDNVKQFGEQNKVNYPLVMGDQATMKMVPRLEGFPTTLFIDRAGKVRLQVVGYHPEEMLEALMLKLLSEPATEEGATSTKEGAAPAEEAGTAGPVKEGAE